MKVELMRRIMSLFVVASALVLSLLAPVHPAEAVWSCRSWAWYTHGYAKCDYGLGGVRVWVRCTNGDIFPGPWVSAGYESVAICRNSYVAAHEYETWHG